MKHFTRKAALTAIIALATATASAQYITEAPAGGFDFSKGKDYVVIYSPASQITAMGDKILSNQNLDPEMVDNQFYYWTADWDKKLFTLYNIEDAQQNSYGVDDKLSMTPLFEWGSGNFSAKAKAYDLSDITDDHILHIGFMNIGAEGASAQFQFSLGPTDANGFKLQVNTEVGSMSGKFVGVGNATSVNKWYYLDIPVKDLIDEDGDFGFEYDFSSPIDGSIFTCGFNGATCSKYTQGAVNPDTGMYSITITEKGSALAIDGVFLYKKDNSTGIHGIETESSDNAIYNLSGQRVVKGGNGIVIMKTANGTKKGIFKN